MNNYIKSLINDNKLANERIANLEQTIALFNVKTEKDKANFSNLTIALHGYRMISDATECLLLNENVVKTDEGEYYEKIDNTTRVPENSKPKGSDLDVDKENNHE